MKINNILGIVLRILHAFSLLFLINPHRIDGHFHPHFTEKETETPKIKQGAHFKLTSKWKTGVQCQNSVCTVCARNYHVYTHISLTPHENSLA